MRLYIWLLIITLRHTEVGNGRVGRIQVDPICIRQQLGTVTRPNEINNMSESIPNQIMDLENEIINIINNEHSKINMQVPFRTNIRGEINTENNRAIYSKQYPYALLASDFVNSEVNRMMKKGIKRPSKSSYNSSILVLPKKGFNEDGTAKLRLVIDCKKLNENTISDRYATQDPSVILSNLGKTKYFSTIDLESGFHQIFMKETDIE